MVNLDLDLLDQDKVRKKKRHKIFLIVALPLLIILVIATIFLRTSLYDVLFYASINGGNYDFASFENNAHKIGNFVEPYLVYYNSGYTNLIRAKTINDLAVAEADFRESLKNNPPDEKLCPICVNMSYSIELRGDQLFLNKEYAEAIVAYNSAEAVLYENGCASKDSSKTVDKDNMAKDAKSRIEETRRKAVDAINGSSNNAGQDDQGESENKSELTDEDLAAIEAMRDQSAAEAISNPYRARGSDTTRPSYNGYGSHNW